MAVRDLSLEVRPGEVFGFVGCNGAGKTTTMRIVLGVLLPDAGEVRWAGSPIGFETRRRIGYMPEERGLYPKMRIGEQLTYLAPFSPVLMPARMATGDAQAWQVAVAVVLALAAIAGLNALAARIYSNSVLKVGSRVSLIDAWRGRA